MQVKLEIQRLYHLDNIYILIKLTFLRCMEGIIFWYVLDVIFQRGLWQDKFVLIDFVNGVFKGQLRAAILLVMSEYST